MAAFWSEELEGGKYKIWIRNITKSCLSEELENFFDDLAAFRSEELKGGK